MSKTKLFVIYHKPEELIKDEIYTPICVGPNKDQFTDDYLRDDLGDNISNKNSSYNELTAIYWVYKHLYQFENVDNIGFCHYRRLFAFSDLSKTAFVRKANDPQYTAVSDNQFDSYFKDYDFILPCPTTNKTVRKHYEKSHNKEDIDLLLDIIKETHFEYYKAALEYVGQYREYLYNMFVFKKEDFEKYAEFMFTVMDEFAKRKPCDRYFISERITGIFAHFLILQGKNPLFVPIYHIRKKNHKEARKQYKENKAKGKEYGLFFRIKPILLFYFPLWLEQYLRRRISR